MRKRSGWTIIACGAILFTACASPRTDISGTVQDQVGPIQGAVVRVQTTELSTTTDNLGRFTLSGLSSGQPVFITAWAQGYYIVRSERALPPGTRDATLELTPHPTIDEKGYAWLSAYTKAGDKGNCQNCHSQPDPIASPRPFDEWLQDAHSGSASNRRFLSMYLGTDLKGNASPPTRKGYSRDYGSFPLAPDPGLPYFGPGYKLDFPESAGNCSACHVPVAAVEDPYGVDPTQVTGTGLEGVSCDFCHKIWDVHLDDRNLPHPQRPGVLSYEFLRPGDGHQLFIGPFDDVAPGEDTYSPLQQQSQFCAPCHFGIFWDTLVYNSYGEWLASPYSDPGRGQTCQDCHMPAGSTDHFAILEAGGLIRDPATINSHLMPGAADEKLLENAVSLKVEARRDDGQVVIYVTVTNDNTGHHIPTDSPLRHLILLIRALDMEGNALSLVSGPTVPEWGGIGDPDQGYYAGLPGTAYAKVLQELWTEAVPSGAYWNPTRILSDNRIPAMESDLTHYRFEGSPDSTIAIEVKLIYRRAFIELMDQKAWDAPDILVARALLKLD